MKNFRTPRSSSSRSGRPWSPVAAQEGGRSYGKDQENKRKRAFSKDADASERAPRGERNHGFAKSGAARAASKEKPSGYAPAAGKPVRKASGKPFGASFGGTSTQSLTKSSAHKSSGRPVDRRAAGRPVGQAEGQATVGYGAGSGKPKPFKKPAGGRSAAQSTRHSTRQSAGQLAGQSMGGRGAGRSATPQRDRGSLPQVAPGSVLLWGLHAVAAAWLNPLRVCTQLYVTEAGEKTVQSVVVEGKARGLPRPEVVRVDRSELDRLTPQGSVHQGIVCAVKPLPEMDLHDVIGAEVVPDVVLVLDQVTDPHNVGAILRSAAAFGAGAVIMTERNAPSATGVLAKSASGALDVVPMVHVVNLSRALDDLREAGYWCVGLAEEGARSLAQLDLTARTAIVLGAEGEGLRHLTRQKCDEMAHLPTSSELGSLNVSNAAAVALYEVKRQKAV